MARPHSPESRLGRHLLECEREFIHDVVVSRQGHVETIARELGVSPRHAYAKLTQYGLTELAHSLKAAQRTTTFRRQFRMGEKPAPLA